MGCGGSKKAPEAVIAPESKPIKDDNKEGESATPISAPPAAFEFKVVVEREADEPLGVKVDFPTSSPTLSANGSNALLILLVRPEGLLPGWNLQKQSSPEFQIKEGDLIVEVNSVKNDTTKMMEQVTEKVVTLLIQRPVSVETKESAVEPAVAVVESAENVENATSDPCDEPKTEEAAAVDAQVAPAEPEQALKESTALSAVDLPMNDDGVIPVELEDTEVNKDTEKKVCGLC
jgi:hypothetical protein